MIEEDLVLWTSRLKQTEGHTLHCHSLSACWNQKYLCVDAHLECPETDRRVREGLKHIEHIKWGSGGHCAY